MKACFKKKLHGQRVEVFPTAIYNTLLFFLLSSKLFKTVK